MTFPANYAVIAEDELTYVNGGGVIANVLPAVMTSDNWKTFSVNVIKIVGNSFLSSFVSTVLGTAFGTNYAFGAISDNISSKLAGMDFLNGAMQVVGGLATIYTLGTTDAKVKQSGVIGVDGEKVA